MVPCNDLHEEELYAKALLAGSAGDRLVVELPTSWR
jgi:hypothetical protein|tara:strand:+ start:37 stop:144 length:108 start_codon:yes stop_codon:yes gene_type:complete